MNQRQTNENKRMISAFNEQIKRLGVRTSILENAKRSFMVSVVNNTLANMHDLEPIHASNLVFGDWECGISPIGVCVYNKETDPTHKHCVFCHDPEGT